MKLTKTTWIRAGRWIGMSLIGLAWAWVACAQTISTTSVQGTVYLANGAPGSGTLQLSWPAFTTASGNAIAAGRTSTTIGTDGFVSVNLVPNLGSSPAGLFYTAVYNMSDGSASTEYWVVPAAAQATVAQVRAQVMPAAQAVQAVTKSYVDQAIQTAATSLSPSGGTLTSPLYLSGDPTQSLQAADKHYVDTSFALALPLSGGTLTGPGYAASDPPGGALARNQFATQHYADTSQRYNVKDAGVVGDGRAGTVTTATAGGITTVTCNACSFTSADVGKTINIPGAGVAYLHGGTLGAATATINSSGVVTGVTFSAYSGLPASATIPVTFSSAGSAPAVTARGYITTDGSGVPTMHIWVGGMDYTAAPTISAGWAQDGANLLPGAGLKTTIASVVDSTHVTLAAAATTDVTTGVKAYYGTDDTTALNAALQTILSQPINWTNGGQQFFVPCGTYLISAPLTVNNSSAIPTGFRILGSAMGCAKFVQLTDNTPILNFTQGGAWGFQVSDLSFDYANYQSPNFTNSVSVYFNASGTGNNFFTWDMSRLMFFGGFRGIGIGNTNQSVWGYTIDRVTGGSGLSGATLYLSNAGGDPRIQLRHIYSTQTIGEPVISTGVAGSVTASSIEADNAYGTVFSLLGNHLQLNDAECELCSRAANGQFLVVAYASDVNVRGSDDHAIPPNIGSPISVIEYQTTSAPTLVAGSVDIQQSVVKVDPCYGISSGCAPPAHYAYIGQDNQLTAQTFKGNFVYAAPPETLSGSGMLSAGSNALLFGTVTQQNLATSDGMYVIPNASSPYYVDASRAVYQKLVLPANIGNSNFSFQNGWTGAKVRVRLIQPPQGAGPFTVSSPNNVLGLVPPPLTNGAGSGTGATCTAAIGSGGVSSVSCSGGTGYPASTPIWLQFTGGATTPYAQAAAYITTNASGNLTGNASMVSSGAGYTSAPAVGVGLAWSEQTFTFNESLQKWVANGPAKLFDGVTLTTQQAVTATATAIQDTGTLSASALSTDGSGNVKAASTTGTGSVVLANSPALTGTPTAPTAAQGTNTTQVATTAFVRTALMPAVLIGSGDLACGAAGDSTIAATGTATGATVSGTGPYTVTYTVPSTTVNYFNYFVGAFIQAQGFSPSGFNIAGTSPATVTAVTSTSITVSMATNPGTFVSGGTISLACANQTTDAGTGGSPFIFSTAYTVPANYFAAAGASLSTEYQLQSFNFTSGTNPNLVFSQRLNNYGYVALNGGPIQTANWSGGTLGIGFRTISISPSHVIASTLGIWGVGANQNGQNYSTGPFATTTAAQPLTLVAQYTNVSGVALGTYTSGGTITGSAGQTCTLSSFNGATGTTATVALTGTNVVASGTALTMTYRGYGATAAPTSATLGNGTATCSGAATITSTIGPQQGIAVLLQTLRVAP